MDKGKADVLSLMGDESLFDKIKSDFDAALSAMKEYHNDWRQYDEAYQAKFWNPQRASWRPKPVINYVAYVVDQKKPQITQNRPTGVLLPTSDEDREAAQLFTQATDAIAERVDLESSIEELVQTGLLLDIAWMKIYWDNSLTGGNPANGTAWVGDVAIDVPDPCNVYPDPMATRVQDCRFIIYAVPKQCKWIERFAQQQGKPVKIEPENTFETEIYNRPGSDSTSKDRAMFYEYWWIEDGKICVAYAAQKYVFKKIIGVYNHGRYPFIPFVAKKKRKSIVGIGEPRNIFENTQLLNKLVEMPTTSSLLTANPIALIDAQSGIDPNKWIAKPGTAWKVKDVDRAVKWLEPPQFSSDIYKLADMMTTYIEKIAGIYDANTGETPGGVTAAAAIQMLQEQGSIPIKGIARNLYATIKEAFKQMVELIKQNYTEERFIRVDQGNGVYDFIPFTAAQYAQVDFDIKVSAGASTPMTKAYLAQLASDLFDKGVMPASMYVEVIGEGLPNKDRLIQYLQQQEQSQMMAAQAPAAGGGMMPQGAPMGAQQMPGLDQIYAQAPPELQREIDMLREQGMPDEQIVQQLMQLLKN